MLCSIFFFNFYFSFSLNSFIHSFKGIYSNLRTGVIKNNTKTVNYLIFIDYTDININPDKIKADIRTAGYIYIPDIIGITKKFICLDKDTKLMFATLPDLTSGEDIDPGIKNIFSILPLFLNIFKLFWPR